jgi:putative membrane protein
MKRIILTLAVLVGLSTIPAIGQTPSGSGQSKPAPPQQPKAEKGKAGALTAADRNFVREAAVGGMAEVELGQLAADKASSADVKQFGKRMSEDHGKANDELKSWASKKSVDLPAELDAKHKAMKDQLSKLTGEAFDRGYMKQMVADHNKDVQAFAKAARGAGDPELKSWAEKTLPTLKEHQKMAQDLSAKVAGTAKKGTVKQ